MTNEVLSVSKSNSKLKRDLGLSLLLYSQIPYYNFTNYSCRISTALPRVVALLSLGLALTCKMCLLTLLWSSLTLEILLLLLFIP